MGIHHRSLSYLSKQATLKKSLFQSAVLISAMTAFSIWGFSWIPFDKLPVSHFWMAISYRAVTAFVWLVLIWALKPRMFRRLFVVQSPFRLLIGFGVVTYLTLPQLLHTSYKGHSIWAILEGFIFALFIGVDEELFSRGLIYGFLDKYGINIAAVLSSIHFGLLHLGNVVWGGQSFEYTAGQAVNAAAFGYLACGLMVFTGTIWMPILLHGISDFPMQMQSAVQYKHQVTGGFDWMGTMLNFLVYVGVGYLLLRLSRSKIGKLAA